jgi:hypothetical protein
MALMEHQTRELRVDAERPRRERFEDLAGPAPDPGDESADCQRVHEKTFAGPSTSSL